MIWTTSDATICAESDAGLIVQNITSQAIDVTWELPNGAMGTVEDIPTNNPLEGILLLPGVNFPSAGQYVVEATPTDAFGCVGDPIEGLVEVENLPSPTPPSRRHAKAPLSSPQEWSQEPNTPTIGPQPATLP